MTDPYVIEGWEINASEATGIEIRNTGASFVIGHVYVHSSVQDYKDIFLEHVGHAMVNNVTLEGGSTGLDAEVADSYVVTNSTIGGASNGLVCRVCTNTTISDNDINGSTEGMYVGSSPDISILGNRISYSQDFGLRVDPLSSPNVAPRPVVENNAFLHNGEGVYLYAADGGTVAGNVVMYNGAGIGLPYSSNNSAVQANVIAWNREAGIDVGSSTDTSIDENNLSHNGLGIYLHRSVGTRSFHNNFMNNTVQASDSLGVGTIWNLTYPQGGNYWSDYTGHDNCSGLDQTICPGPDGFGDTPYPVVDMTELDHYPLMEPYPIAHIPSPALISIWISANPTSGTVPLSVSFTSHVIGGVPSYSYDWVFGDGSRGAIPNPAHTFISPGIYTVTLAVRDSQDGVAAATTTVTAYASPSVGGQSGVPFWLVPLSVGLALAAFVASLAWWRRRSSR